MRPLSGGADSSAGEPVDEQRLDLREVYRKQMLASIGGWSGTVITALPTVVFVIVNALSTLRIEVHARQATPLSAEDTDKVMGGTMLRLLGELQ